jgi:hypothetical protein
MRLMRLVQVVYFMATEVVLFWELGENEVVDAIDFGRNRKRKLRRFEHPTRRDASLPRGASLRDAKRGEGFCHFYRKMHPYGMQREARVFAISTERCIPTGCKERRGFLPFLPKDASLWDAKRGEDFCHFYPHPVGMRLSVETSLRNIFRIP